MKNKKVINIMESFSTNFKVDTNLTGIKKINRNQIPTFLHGNWTSNTSDFINNKTAVNTIRFNIKNINSGTMFYRGQSYKITNVDYNGTITTEKKNGNQYIFAANFNLGSDMRLPIDLPENIPTMKMISKGNDESETSIIFKFMRGDLNSTAKEMVKYDQIHSNISGLMYSEPSVRNITNYKFRYDAITGIYKNYDELNLYQKQKLPKLKEKYNNIVSFQLLRAFTFANSQYVWSRYSQVYNIKLTKGNQVLIGLKFRRLKEELNENKLGNHYNISSYVFLHKNTNFNIEYDYNEPNIVFSKDELKLENGATNYFEDWISSPNITSAEKKMTGDFNQRYIYFYYNYRKDNIKESNNIENRMNNILNYL